jgi:hypothetical protein
MVHPTAGFCFLKNEGEAKRAFTISCLGHAQLALLTTLWSYYFKSMTTSLISFFMGFSVFK